MTVDCHVSFTGPTDATDAEFFFIWTLIILHETENTFWSCALSLLNAEKNNNEYTLRYTKEWITVWQKTLPIAKLNNFVHSDLLFWGFK